MAWRGLHVSRPSRLSLDHGRLRIEQGEENAPLFFPLEDLAWIILDAHRCHLSSRLISACMEADVLIVFPDQKHMPCGITLSFHQHHAQAQIARMQVSLSRPFRKRLWSQIVRAKIRAQGENLFRLGKGEEKALLAMVTRVRSGDPRNVEARAARYYWPRLFEDFRRHDESDLRNALLNYGYACVRAALSRALAASGFIPSLGIHHDGRFNAFNLADDLIEPYRPIVDWMARERLNIRGSGVSGEEMSLEDRQVMAAILEREVAFGREKMSLLHATERTVQSLRQAMEQGNPEMFEAPGGW